MSYPFVPSPYDYGPLAEARAWMIHMAEGGGTVAFLSRPNARGVSVHFVVEYSGRVVQMTHMDKATGSLNPAATRHDEGPPPYGWSVFEDVLGSDGAWNPNAYVLSVEIEGFARNGPNPEQTAALRSLVISASPDTISGTLGHRDQQNYKPCPGGKIDWASIGGHGLWHGSDPNQPGGDMSTTTVTTFPGGPRQVSFGPGSYKGWNPNGTSKTVTFTVPLSVLHASGEAMIDQTGHDDVNTPPPHGGPFLAMTDGGLGGLYFREWTDQGDTTNPGHGHAVLGPSAPVYGQADLDNARAAGAENQYATSLAAVEASAP